MPIAICLDLLFGKHDDKTANMMFVTLGELGLVDESDPKANEAVVVSVHPTPR